MSKLTDGQLQPIEIDEARFLKDHFALPPLPEVATRIMEKISSGDTGPREIAKLLSSDAALVALVFKLVNSAYYSLPRRIDQINQAVAFLGLAEINRLVMALSVMKVLEPRKPSDFQDFWRHSFYSALISRSVARLFFRSLELEGLYTAVLLHDIGKLVYMKFFPDHYSALTEYSQGRRCFFYQAEERLGLPSHQRFGVLLCDRWQLPDTVSKACAFHELGQLRKVQIGEQEEEFEVVAAVANLMAHLADGTLTDDLKEACRQEIQRVLDCSEEDFLIAMAEVYDLQDSVENFLGQLR
ncbi:MAG TPA: HDOD domain-containing protein [Acidobacteriota bacterium]|nr:HDOD domain-containing protein [Acidobacteriota bacterium]